MLSVQIGARYWWLSRVGWRALAHSSRPPRTFLGRRQRVYGMACVLHCCAASGRVCGNSAGMFAAQSTELADARLLVWTVSFLWLTASLSVVSQRRCQSAAARSGATRGERHRVLTRSEAIVKPLDAMAASPAIDDKTRGAGATIARQIDQESGALPIVRGIVRAALLKGVCCCERRGPRPPPLNRRGVRARGKRGAV